MKKITRKILKMGIENGKNTPEKRNCREREKGRKREKERGLSFVHKNSE